MYKRQVSGFYGGLCLFIPVFSIFLPLFCYDCARTRRKFPGVILILASVPYFINRLFFLRIDLVLSLLLSLFLAVRTQKLENMREKFKKLRDDSTELNLLDVYKRQIKR